jgi:hypothetical protein
MPRDDYDRIVYVILSELYRCLKAGERIAPVELTPEALGIPEAYRDDILEELLSDGLTRGYKVKQYINGRAIIDLEQISITPDGIHYLKENSAMKKVMEWIKTAKDIIPGV